MHIELDLPYATIYSLATHLIHWRRADIISVLSTSSVLNSQKDLKISDSLTHEYNRIFGERYGGLVQLISKFDSPKNMREIFPSSSKKDLVPLITWLLRKGAVKILNPHVYLLPRRIYSALKIPPHSDTLPQSFVDECLKFITADSEHKETLIKILPYCNGKFNLDEIAYREQIYVSSIQGAIQQYSTILRLVYHN